METTPTMQLKADLSMILTAIRQDPEVSAPVKKHLGEMVAWLEAHVEHSKELDDRLESSEAALEEIIEGGGEMLSQESVAVLTAANEHAVLLCQATAALLDGPLATKLDEVSKKRFHQVIENAQRAIALSMQLINELAVDGDDADDEEDDDGLGDGDDGDTGDGDDEGVGEGADEEENVDGG